MSGNTNQQPRIPSISTTETFLLECSRSNSLIDKNKLQAGEENASWINQTGNFRVKKGDQINVEMCALNLSQTSSPMEFTGYNVILEGSVTKPYVDNRVVLEIGYYINNNQSYTCNLPLNLSKPINNAIDPLTGEGVNGISINITPNWVDTLGVILNMFGTYPGLGLGFGYRYNDTDAITGISNFQSPIQSATAILNSYRIVGFTDFDYVTPLPNPLPVGQRAYSVVLERDFPGSIPSTTPLTPSTYTSYFTFLRWSSNTQTGDEPCYGKVGMEMNFQTDNPTPANPQPWERSNAVVVDIKANTAPFNGGVVDPLRVQICFGTHPVGGIGGGLAFTDTIAQGNACCFSTPNIRYNQIYSSQAMANWNVTPLGSAATTAVPLPPNGTYDANYSQKRQGSGITDFFSNGIAGYTQTGDVDFGTIPEDGLAYINNAYPHTPSNDDGTTGSVTRPTGLGVTTAMSFLQGGGLGSSNRQQGTDNLPYILLRNDYMGCQPKANCEDIGRYGTWCPDLHPLTSFVVLEASDLLMDATALAAKINEKLHASLPGVGDNGDDIDEFHTNIYGFTKRYKKSSQLLPYTQTAGYYPQLPFQQTDGVMYTPIAPDVPPPPLGVPNLSHAGGFGAVVQTNIGDDFTPSILTYRNNQLWTHIDPYYSGGTKQIIPANLQPGWGGLAMIGYNSNITINMEKYIIDRQLNGDAYPSFEATYLRTCKRPPDFYGDACSWNNVINGNKGVKDLYKHMWGDIFNKLPVWDGNYEPPAQTIAQRRNISRPVILNSQLQQITCGGQLLNFQQNPTLATPQQIYYGTSTFRSTVLIKNQMIFTNIYYDEAAMLLEGETNTGGITKQLAKLIQRQRDYEIFINTSNTTANTYEKQREDKMGYAIKLDLGVTDDERTSKWTTENPYSESFPMRWSWDGDVPANIPAPSTGGTNPSYLNPNVANGTWLNPTSTSVNFGSGNMITQSPPPIAVLATPRWDWNRNQNVSRPVGKIWIQSRYDPDWVITSNTGGEVAPYPAGEFPQVPESLALNETMCKWNADPLSLQGKPFVDDSWSKDNDMGIYPYEYTDDNVPPQTHIFMAFRVAQLYKAADNTQINSQITNTWRIGQLSWGLPFGFSPSEYDNYQVIPMNPDTKRLDIERVDLIEEGTVGIQNVLAPRELIQNCNGYIAVGANNPTFSYNVQKSRMELSKTYQSTRMSPYNTASVDAVTAAPDLPELGEPIAIYNDICPDAAYSPPPTPVPFVPLKVPPTIPGVPLLRPNSGGGGEKCQNVRAEESGIFIYKVWLPDENWNPPTDINLYSYWSNNSPDNSEYTSRFAAPLTTPPVVNLPNYEVNTNPNNPLKYSYSYRDNQDGTEDNRQLIIKGMTEATPGAQGDYRGCLLDKLGFTIDQFLPPQGRQWNRYTVNGYNNPQPDLIVTQNTKPFMLNTQSNITLNPGFNLHYITPALIPPADPPISGLPNYGLGFSNGQPTVIASTDSFLTANNPIESTNSPFFQIYSTICPNNYLDNGTKKGILFYCMKNYQSGNYSYGYGSTFAHTATKDYNLDYINTEIRNPISGRLMRVLQPNSVITYKITRPIVLAPDAYNEQGLPLDPDGEPLAEGISANDIELFNIVPPEVSIGGNVGVPPNIEPDGGEGQPPMIYFNGNNQVVNLAGVQQLNYQQAQQQAFAGDVQQRFDEDGLETKVAQEVGIDAEDDEQKMTDPMSQVAVASGLIALQLTDSKLNPEADPRKTLPTGEGNVDRSQVSARELLYDYLVHITLNELIPVNLMTFGSPDEYANTMAEALGNIQKFAVGHSSGGRLPNIIDDIARRIEQGMPKEEGLRELGDQIFGTDGKKNPFMINEKGAQVRGRGNKGTPDNEFFYAIHPRAAQQIAQLMATRRPEPLDDDGGESKGPVTRSGGASERDRNLPPTGFTEELAGLIKKFAAEDNIVMEQNKKRGDGMVVDTWVQGGGLGARLAKEDEYQFQRIPEKFRSGAQGSRSNRRDFTMGRAELLPVNFVPADFIEAEGKGEGSQYLAELSGSDGNETDRVELAASGEGAAGGGGEGEGDKGAQYEKDYIQRTKDFGNDDY